MRRLYSLITGLIFSLILLQAKAQNDVANFTFIVSGNTVHFTNTSTTVSADTAFLRCYWQFGDSSVFLTYFSTNPYHTYSHPGTFQACLRLYARATNAGGVNDSLVLISSVCKTVAVTAPDSCSASFQTLLTGSTPLGKYFIAQPWDYYNKKPVQVCWNFGDNHDTCIQYPTNYTGGYATYHSYAQSGKYNACVSILYDGGCQSKYCDTVNVAITADSCSANFETLQSTNPTSLGKYFIAQPWNNHNKKPVQVCWSFGDNRDTCIQYSATYTGSYAAFHLYADTGTYNVCVKILYDGGCQSYFCKPVQINIVPDSCSANFEILSTNYTSLGKYFVAQPWNNYGKKPIQVCWSFGDNRDTCIQYSTIYTGSYATYHLFAQSGTYNVCVSIVYDGGCQSKYCKSITVVGVPDSCSANIAYPITTNAISLGKYFVALPWNSHSKKPIQVCWSFGDNRDTCIQYSTTYTGGYAVYHLYADSGRYNVCVKILYDGGCLAYKCDSINIVLPPDICRVQEFEVTQSITSRVVEFYAAPSSSNKRSVERICWNFGDGTDTCVVSPAATILPVYSITHTYPGTGVYHPCVTVLFTGGCTATKCIEVVIRSATDICGGYFTDSLIAPTTYKFDGHGITNSNDHVISYQWSFGDGGTATGEEVVHTFAPGTDFNVCLYINTEQKCESRICKRIAIPGPNVPTLQLSPNPVISNLHVVFFSNFTETVNIRIVNVSGLIVKTYIKSVTTGPNDWDFDLSGLLPGIYNFIIQSSDQLASSLFLKQ